MYKFSTEMVFRGHPDKVCDQISDAILDEILSVDKNGRVACEVVGGKGKIFITGEITTNADINYTEIAKRVLRDVGYSDNIEIIVNLSAQSYDIALGVDKEGAGDQGLMFGYAEKSSTHNISPLFYYTKQLAINYDKQRRTNELLRPDGKCQLTGIFDQADQLIKIDTVVFSFQHVELNDNDYQNLLKEMEVNIKSIIPESLLDSDSKIFINPTGRFVVGGFDGDSGLTGRKIICDTYGGFARHGGGAFSGKDCTKVDRSAALIARQIAITLIEAGLYAKCEIQLSYGIGISYPMAVYINSFDQEAKLDKETLVNLILEFGNVKPKEIIESLDLKNTRFEKQARFGAFGNDKFVFEKANQTLLKEILKRM
ncbi:MAG: methionine adenosyltransferase [Erysipelotrichaceae bacterium]